MRWRKGGGVAADLSVGAGLCALCLVPCARKPHTSSNTSTCLPTMCSLPLQQTKDFTSVVITDTGKINGKFLGIVTPRDIDFVNDRLTPLSEVMTK